MNEKEKFTELTQFLAARNTNYGTAGATEEGV